MVCLRPTSAFRWGVALAIAIAGQPMPAETPPNPEASGRVDAAVDAAVDNPLRVSDAAARAAKADSRALPEGWVRRTDASGDTWYEYLPTGATQWARPAE